MLTTGITKRVLPVYFTCPRSAPGFLFTTWLFPGTVFDVCSKLVFILFFIFCFFNDTLGYLRTWVIRPSSCVFILGQCRYYHLPRGAKEIAIATEKWRARPTPHLQYVARRPFRVYAGAECPFIICGSEGVEASCKTGDLKLREVSGQIFRNLYWSRARNSEPSDFTIWCGAWQMLLGMGKSPELENGGLSLYIALVSRPYSGIVTRSLH